MGKTMCDRDMHVESPLKGTAGQAYVLRFGMFLEVDRMSTWTLRSGRNYLQQLQTSH